MSSENNLPVDNIVNHELLAAFDPQQLQHLLTQVRTGELEPKSVVRLLLGEAGNAEKMSANLPSGTNSQDQLPAGLGDGECLEVVPLEDDHAESLASLLGRLGDPPEDVLDGWCKQLCYASIVHHEETGQPLPSIDPHLWKVNHAGELAWNQFVFRVSPDAEWPRPDSQSMQHIIQFRDQFADQDRAVETRADQANRNDGVLQREVRRTAAKEQRSSPTSSAGRYLFAAAMAILMAGIGVILFRAKNDRAGSQLVGSQQSGNQTKSNSAATSVTSADASSSDFFNPIGSKNASVNLSTEPLGEDASSTSRDDGVLSNSVAGDSVGEPDAVVDLGLADTSLSPALLSVASQDTVRHADLSLDALIPDASMPDAAMPDSGLAKPANDTDGAGPERDVMSSIEQGDAIDPLADDNSPGPAETPQPTRAAGIAAKLLPTPEDTDAIVELFGGKADGLKLEFSQKVAMELSLAESKSAQVIRSSRSQTSVARIANSDDGVRLQWTDNAAKESVSRLLIHGRMKDAAGGVTYLRPVVQADPMKIRLDESDVQPTWDLAGPIPTGTRLSVKFRLPGGVDEGWIEPIDPKGLRRTRGLAVLTPKDGESVSLGVRFDVRCSRKLSLRIRYAARLDNSLPWQMVSRPMLERLADQITGQQAYVSDRLIRLDKLSSAADYGLRREIRSRRELVEGQAKQLKLIADRVADLQGLIALLESEGSLMIRVSVPWPDAEQVLLETVAAEGAGLKTKKVES